MAARFDGEPELGRATAPKIRTTEIDLPDAESPWMEAAAPETIDVLDWVETSITDHGDVFREGAFREFGGDRLT